MDKRRLHQIVSILLIPYCDEHVMYFEKDPIANIRHSFYCLSHRQEKSMSIRKNLRDKYLSAEKMLDSYLRKRNDLRIHSIDDFRMLVEHCFPERAIVDLYNKIDSTGKAPLEAIDWFYYQQLFSISNSLLTFRDGRIAIKTWFTENDDMDQLRYPDVFDKVEIWNLLSRLMATDIFIAAFFISCGRTDVYNLYHQQGTIFLADKTLENIYKKGMAETHLHFNAGMEFQYLWHAETDLRNWNLGDDTRTVSIEAAVYRFIWAIYVEYRLNNEGDDNLDRFIDTHFTEYSRQIKEIISCLYHNRNYPKDSKFESVKTGILSILSAADAPDLFMENIYSNYAGLGTTSEMIFLFRSLLYFNKFCDIQNYYVGGELHLFLQYIRIKNRIYNQVVQSNQIQGLANFRFFYGEMSYRNYAFFADAINRGEMVFRSVLSNSYLKKLEIRIVPKMIEGNCHDLDKRSIAFKELKKDILKQVKDVLIAYKIVLDESLGIIKNGSTDDEFWKKCDSEFKDNKLCAPSIGIIFHFLKRNDVDNRIPDTCWLSRLKEQAVGKYNLLELRESMIQSACAIEELRGEIPLLSEYVVGIDVASEEIKTEPWIFAQIYHEARNRMITKPVYKTGDRVIRVNNMGFTFHVGEEFRHILSGLRHIDEVLTYFHYKAGDRIGHATALGVSLDYWMNSNEAVVMPILEYMEDLIWLWGNMVDRKWGLQINVEALEGRILSLAKKVFRNLDGINVYMLYEAYKLKFSEDFETIFVKTKEMCSLNHLEETDLDNTAEHFCKNYNREHRLGDFWTVEKVFCTYFCPVYTQLYNEPIIVQVEDIEKPLLETVQMKVREEVEKQGIYVETNPTSNLAIGEQKSLFSHHILSLNSRGLNENQKSDNRQVLVSVNTDNPVIFCTNIENELAYVYHSLIHLGYGRESVLEWMDKVRQMGMNSSFVKAVKKPSQQYQEIQDLIESINNYISI